MTTYHTVSGSTFKPDGVNVNVGNWTISIYSSTGYAFSNVAGTWVGGKQVWTTKNDGSLSISLPETDGSNYYYQASFRSLDKTTSYGPFVFDLTANKTWTDIMTEPSPVPVTPPLVTQAQSYATAAQGWAQQAQAAASAILWEPSTAYAAGAVVTAPDGSSISRLANGTSRASFDATEAAAWKVQITNPASLAGAAAAAAFVQVVKPEQFGTNVGTGSDDTAAFVAMWATANSSAARTVFQLTSGKTYNVNTGALTWSEAKGFVALTSSGRRQATINVVGTGAGTSFLNMAWSNTNGTNLPYEVTGIRLVGSGTFDAYIRNDDVVDAAIRDVLIEGAQGQQADIWVRNVNGWSERFFADRVRELNRTLNSGSGRLIFFDTSSSSGSVSFARASLTNIALTSGNSGVCKIDMSTNAAVYDSILGPVVGNLNAGVHVLKITGNMRGTRVWMPQCESSADTAYCFELDTLSGGFRPQLFGKFSASGAHMAEWVTAPISGTLVWEPASLQGIVSQFAQSLKGVDLLAALAAAQSAPLNPALYLSSVNTGAEPFNVTGNVILQLASSGRLFSILDYQGNTLFSTANRTAGTSSFTSATNSVNVNGKYAGKTVFNTTTHKNVTAAGSNPTDVWYDQTGTVAHTPA